MSNKDVLLEELDGEVKCGLCGSKELHFLAVVDTNGDLVGLSGDEHFCQECLDDRWVIPVTDKCEEEVSHE
ncbi:MAG: hypothetical protein ACR2NI_08630 [Pirellulales bacterium]